MTTTTTLDMSKADSREFFQKNGFAYFKNVFSGNEVATMRQQVLEIFKKPSEFAGDWDDKPPLTAIRADLFNRYQQLRWIFYKPEIHAALKKILGDDIGFVPESVAHYKGFGSWHKDTTSQENTGMHSQHEADWLMVECAVYMQDNVKEYGGGLDVVPGSHKSKDDFLSKKGNNVVDRLLNKVSTKMVQNKKSKQAFHIPSKAGDFIFFNKKLDHRASPCKSPNVPVDKEKLAAFFIGGVNNKHLGHYIDYIKNRKDYLYMINYQLNKDFANECKERGINLIT